MANDWNKMIIDEFRAHGGKVGGQFAGAPLLILHSIGAKSGKTRVHSSRNFGARPLMTKRWGAR